LGEERGKAGSRENGREGICKRARPSANFSPPRGNPFPFGRQLKARDPVTITSHPIIQPTCPPTPRYVRTGQTVQSLLGRMHHTTTSPLRPRGAPLCRLTQGLSSPDGKKASPPISVSTSSPQRYLAPSGIGWQRGPGRSNPNMATLMHGTRQMHGHLLCLIMGKTGDGS
jgi:hypothetical protein